MTHTHDVFIAGGGVAGLIAAAAFGAAGFKVLCVDPAPPVTEAADPGADLRSTAFLQPARALLEEAGLWDRLAPHAVGLRVMRIVDATGKSPLARDFEASDLGEAPFGWNFPNWLLRRAALDRLADLPDVTFRPGVGFAGMVTRDEVALITLSDGSTCAARLALAADGRNSALRSAMGIPVRTRVHGQKALVFAVAHDRPHEGISTEIHRSGGPFTLVPLPDRDGQPCSAVVWMEDGPAAEALAALTPAAFEAAATDRSAHEMGPLRLISGRQLWPIITQAADRLIARRSALMAESAHVIPPIGAQGLNMSLADLRALLDLARARPDELGAPAMLARYQRERLPDIRLRVAGVGLLNFASRSAAPALTALRRQGIALLHDLTPLRRAAMQLGLGARSRP